MNIEIREVRLAEANKLAVLKQQVWISTYATEGIGTKFSDYVLSAFSPDTVRESLADKSKPVLAAIYRHNFIGCAELLLNAVNPLDASEPCPEIATLYVLERFQGQGAGKKLLSACFSYLGSRQYSKTWLTVYHKNENAIRFYETQHFVKAGETDFTIGKSHYKNFIMIRNL